MAQNNMYYVKAFANEVPCITKDSCFIIRSQDGSNYIVSMFRALHMCECICANSEQWCHIRCSTREIRIVFCISSPLSSIVFGLGFGFNRCQIVCKVYTIHFSLSRSVHRWSLVRIFWLIFNSTMYKFDLQQRKFNFKTYGATDVKYFQLKSTHKIEQFQLLRTHLHRASKWLPM